MEALMISINSCFLFIKKMAVSSRKWRYRIILLIFVECFFRIVPIIFHIFASTKI